MVGPDEREAWIILASTDRIGDQTLGTLLNRFGRASEVLARALTGEVRAWARERRSIDGQWPVLPSTLDLLEAWPRDGHQRLREMVELGLWTVTPFDDDYPPQLSELDPRPPLLVGSGERRLLSAERLVALVGTRRPTPAGRLLAGRICARLVECRAVVVSGLAVGIDGVAHAATIERGGETLAVIGGGHRHPGPRAHAGLRQRIIDAGGAIISEFAPAVEPTKGTYPRRNRIIAALAQATVVVEAPRRSGALITAHRALELGRTVLVAPGRVGDWSTAGSLGLLRDTPARILAGIDEMTADLGLLDPPPDAGADTRVTARGTPPKLSREAALGLLGGAEQAVADCICHAPAGLDGLTAQTGLAPAVVSGAVTLLLMRGWVQQVGPAYLPAGPLLE